MSGPPPHDVGRHRLRLLNDLTARQQNGGTAHRNGQATGHARRNLVRVALDDLDLGGICTDRIGQDLSISGLVALAVRLRADPDLDQTLVREPHVGRFGYATHFSM